MNRFAANTLRVQEASAHLAAVLSTRSFTRAAELLGVQQSAVSHRIRKLEAALGYPLFERTTRQLRPTQAGLQLGEACSGALENIAHMLQRIESQRGESSVRLSATSSATMKWLIPRMGPNSGCDVLVSVYAEDRAVDLAAGEADVALRYAIHPPADLHARKLTACWLRPVASPAYIAAHELDRETPSLAGLDILADRGDGSMGSVYGWDAWGDANGFDPAAAGRQRDYDRADLMLQAAIAGAGVALGRTLLVEDDIARGFLQFVGPEYPVEYSYWLVCTYETAERPAFQELAAWMQRKMRETNALVRRG